jgi:hypothetical protein
VRGIGEELFRNAADIDAGAAEAAGLGDRRARTEIGGEAAGANPAGAAAYGEEIEVDLQLTSGS